MSCVQPSGSMNDTKVMTHDIASLRSSEVEWRDGINHDFVSSTGSLGWSQGKAKGWARVLDLIVSSPGVRGLRFDHPVNSPSLPNIPGPLHESAERLVFASIASVQSTSLCGRVTGSKFWRAPSLT